MNAKRLWAVASKECRELRRDPLFVVLTMVVPIVVMLLYGYSMSFDVENVALAIMDRDGTQTSRQYAERFVNSRYFDFRGYVDNDRQVDRLLMQGAVRVVIVLPEHFERDLLNGRPGRVQTLIDGSMPRRSQLVKSYVVAINAEETRRLITDYVARQGGVSPERAATLVQPFRLEVRYLYNQAARSMWTVAPTLMMLVLIVIPPFYTTMGVVRERESGSIYNIYASTVTRFEFLVGKLVPYVAIAFATSILLYLLATRLFGAPFKGDLSFLFVATLAYVICTTTIGLTVSVLVRTQIAAQLITAVLTMMLAFTHSGLMTPISSMDAAGQVVAHLLPAMYYTEIIHGSFLKGLGWRALGGNVLILVLYAAALLAFSLVMFRKRPAQ